METRVPHAMRGAGQPQGHRRLLIGVLTSLFSMTGLPGAGAENPGTPQPAVMNELALAPDAQGHPSSAVDEEDCDKEYPPSYAGGQLGLLGDRCEEWVVAGAAGGELTVSPVGDRVFTWGNDGLAAHDARTGGKLWEAHLEGISTEKIPVLNLVVGPDGQQVYVVGNDQAAGALHELDQDVVLAAFDAAAGMQSWRTILRLPGIDENDRYVSRDEALGIAASPDGRRVYITGRTNLIDRILCEELPIFCFVTYPDVLVAAYDASTGSEQWILTWEHARRYEVSVGSFIVVSPDSSRVYVGGRHSLCGMCPPSFLLLAVRAHNPLAPAQEGKVLWDSIHDSFEGHPVAIDVPFEGNKVFLTGVRLNAATDPDWATVAYEAATGEPIWVSIYQGPHDDRPDPINRHHGDGAHIPRGIVASSTSDSVFVTGTFEAADPLGDALTGSRSYAATVAYDAATGEQMWEAHLSTLLGLAEPILGSHHSSPATLATSLDMSPDGETVYVTGGSSGLLDQAHLTVAYDAATGQETWTARTPGHDAEQRDGQNNVVSTAAVSVFVAPDTNGRWSVFSTSFGQGSWHLRAYVEEGSA